MNAAANELLLLSGRSCLTSSLVLTVLISKGICFSVQLSTMGYEGEVITAVERTLWH